MSYAEKSQELTDMYWLKLQGWELHKWCRFLKKLTRKKATYS